MRKILSLLLLAAAAAGPASAAQGAVRIKDLARIEASREYSLIGYGLVSGLAGSGDTDRNRVTRQSLVNMLKNFNVSVLETDLASRNTAAVMVTASLGSYSEAGDRIDVQVSSLGDARSLQGGTLLLTPLYGPDQKLYVLAQGSVSVGGYSFEANANSVQKNHVLGGQVPRGGSVERALLNGASLAGDRLTLILKEPDYTTGQRIADALNREMGSGDVRVIHAARVDIPLRATEKSVPQLIARIESIHVDPDEVARVVINERTGTVVAGAHVRLGEVSISQGDLSVEISTRYSVSQPVLLSRPGPGVSTAIVPETDLKVREAPANAIELQEGATVADLVQALNRVHLPTRSIITVLQSIKRAGALHAELVIQ
ncbi:MAG: putative flagellar P-ring protein precuror [Microvirga sp.]|jgi:flagellar P-ring protein precursor FlgI|nr:putative flagellar P-ring protein precuror [Microvirga sp.]